MTCLEAEKLIIPYINRTLTTAELQDLMDHIETCDNCREELETQYMVSVGLELLNDDGQGDYDILGRFLHSISEAKRFLKRITALEIVKYAVDTLCITALVLMLLLQLRIWSQTGFLFF